jgi:hypothetical protein
MNRMTFDTPGQAAADARAHAVLDGADEKTVDSNPTAGDYDHAAEIMRLRDTLTEVLREFHLTGKGFFTAWIAPEHYRRLNDRLEGK